MAGSHSEFTAGELLGMMLLSWANVAYYQEFMQGIRAAIAEDRFDEFRALPTVTVTTDIHCVTSWSKLDTRWEGVALWPLLQELGVTPGVSHVVAHSEQGYTANVPLERLAESR